MQYLRFIFLLMLLMIPITSTQAQNTTLTQVIESKDQSISVRVPSNWLGVDVTELAVIPIYNHALVVGDSQATLEAVALVSLQSDDANTITGKGGFFFSVNRQVFEELIGIQASALNVFTFALQYIQQQGLTYEGPIEYPLGDTTAYAIAVYYGTTASFSMLFERGGLLMGGDLYTNNPNPIEDVALFLEMFNSMVTPSENRQPTQNMNMLAGLTSQQPPTTNQQPQPPAQPTPIPQPTIPPQPTTPPQPTNNTTGNAGPMLSQLQNQTPPPPPAVVVNDDGTKPIASFNGKFQATIPQDWVMLENTQTDLALNLYLTNNGEAVLNYLQNGTPLPNGVVFIEVFVVEGDFSRTPMPDLYEATVSTLPQGAISGQDRYDIVVSGFPALLGVWGLGNQIGANVAVNFNNSVMVIQFLTADESTWDAFFTIAGNVIGTITYQS